MNYEQTHGLFKAMDALETFAKLWQHEVSKPGKSNWDDAENFDVKLKEARKTIFNLVNGIAQ